MYMNKKTKHSCSFHSGVNPSRCHPRLVARPSDPAKHPVPTCAKGPPSTTAIARPSHPETKLGARNKKRGETRWRAKQNLDSWQLLVEPIVMDQANHPASRTTMSPSDKSFLMYLSPLKVFDSHAKALRCVISKHFSL